MKVLHVIDALGLGGGAEHALATMLPEFRERGVDSSVVCLTPREGGLQAQLREQGFDVTVLAATSVPGRVRALRRQVRVQQPDIVHATLFTSCLVTRLSCIGINVARVDSVVNTSYDPVRTARLAIPRWKLRVLRIVDGVTARWLGGHFHALSEAVEREVVEALGIDPSRVTVVPRGRSAQTLGQASPERRQAVRDRLGIGQRVPVLLNVGRQDGAKAQDELVRAFAGVLESFPEALLLIAGREGDATEQLQAALDDVGVREAVRLLGHREDVHDLYVAADIFVFPSHYEGLGSALIEALALDLPIVGSDAPAIREVLGDGAFGRVVPRGDVVHLRRAMEALLRDPSERVRLAAEGRRRFEERYESERVIEAMITIYRSLVATAR